MTASDTTPQWLTDLLSAPAPHDGAEATLRGEHFVCRRGIWRATLASTEDQAQTAEAFAFKWGKRETFERDAAVDRTAAWLRERYGDVAKAAWWDDYGDEPLVVDAGCGAGLSALALFGDRLRSVRYLGVDVSTAVDVAASRFAERELPAGFLQADLTSVPLDDASADVVFSEGVLHHTPSTQTALTSVARLLKPGGRLLFYVYRRKGPVREFTDDLLRARIRDLSPEAAWEALMPLSELGRALGELHVEVDVPQDVELLGIPAGRIDVQRLFYWHVCKAYYHPDLTVDEMNHINYDWFAPAYAHRQSREEVGDWCEGLGLEVEREDVQAAGITMIARRPTE